MRIGGLASGIDTDSVIRSMMEAQRLPLNKITQKKQFIEWQLDDYRSANRDIRSMRDGLLDMTYQSTYMAKTVAVSNENAVSIRALNAQSEFSGEIEVKNLAKAATWQSNEQFNGLKEGDTVNIIAPGANAEGTDFTLGKDESLKDFVSRINKSDAGVNVLLDERTGKVGLSARQSGAGEIEVKINNNVSSSETGTTGEDAVVIINGLEISRSSNTFEVNGFEITLKETTTSPVTFSSATDTEKVFDSVKQFVDDYNKLITELNAKIREPKFRDFPPLSAEQKADMKEKEIELWEEKAMSGTLRNDPTIQRLLSDMRMAITKGIQVTDPETKETTTITLSSIGVSPMKDYLSNGMLEIDEDKLREAIEENPNQVYELLGSAGDKTTTTNEAGEEVVTVNRTQGIIHSIRDAMKNANDTISRRAGSVGSGNDSFTLGRNLKEIDQQIERFQDRLTKNEERLWRQFAAMEQAMNRANAQAQQLMNGLGGMM